MSPTVTERAGKSNEERRQRKLGKEEKKKKKSKAVTAYAFNPSTQ